MKIKTAIMQPVNFLYSFKFLIPAFVLGLVFLIFLTSFLTGLKNHQYRYETSTLSFALQKDLKHVKSEIFAINSKIKKHKYSLKNDGYSLKNMVVFRSVFDDDLQKIKDLIKELELLKIKKNQILNQAEHFHWSSKINDYFEWDFFKIYK